MKNLLFLARGPTMAMLLITVVLLFLTFPVLVTGATTIMSDRASPAAVVAINDPSTIGSVANPTALTLVTAINDALQNGTTFTFTMTNDENPYAVFLDVGTAYTQTSGHVYAIATIRTLTTATMPCHTIRVNATPGESNAIPCSRVVELTLRL